MRRILQFGLVIALVLGMVGYAMPAFASSAQTYTVLVGSENARIGVSIMSFFPQDVTIHVGDTITWVANSHEIHTVTFLAGTSLPDLIIPAPSGMASPLQINPLVAFPTPTSGMYDGNTYMNSGIISTDPGSVHSFSLTFTQEGTFPYVCVVHGAMMSGTIDVVAPEVSVKSPAQVQAQGQMQLKAAWLNVPTVLAKAKAQVTPPTKNPDGTFTHTILLGYQSGNVMVMGFFPKKDTVFPGDTVLWKLSPTNEAPHTVTFYNGAPDQSLVVIAQGENGPVALVNPAVLFPSEAVMQGVALNNTDFFNSGFLMPGGQESFSMKIGNVSGTLNYECILHDTSGMTGSLFVVPKGGK